MEGNKNAMYAKAGRNNGWQVVSGDASMNSAAVAEMPVNPVNPPMPKPTTAPNPAPIPAPPVVVVPNPALMPEPPVVAAPKSAPIPEPKPAQLPMPPVVVAAKAESRAKDCQTLAMAYVEMQKWQEIYEPEKGFDCGTIFTKLDLPFIGEGACKHE